MGPELAAAAPYLLAGGTTLSVLGEREKAREQRNILNRAMEDTGRTQTKAIDSAVTEAKTLAPDARATALQTAQEAALLRARGDVAGGGIIDPSQEGGRRSAAFEEALATREGAEGNRLSAIAGELSKVRGVGDLVQQETQRRSALAEALGSMWSTNKARTAAAANDAQAVDTPLYGEIGKLGVLAGGLGALSAPAAAVPAATGATNPALIDSALGTAGYGASSATPLARSLPLWGAVPLAARRWGAR